MRELTSVELEAISGGVTLSADGSATATTGRTSLGVFAGLVAGFTAPPDPEAEARATIFVGNPNE
jgi:hypothetical protein